MPTIDGVALRFISLSRVTVDTRKIVYNLNPRQLHLPVRMRLGRESLWVIEEADGNIKFIGQPLVDIADRRSAHGAEGPSDPFCLRIARRRSSQEFELVGSISHPNRQRTSDRSAAIIVMVITDVERLAGELRRNAAAEARASFMS